MVLPPKMVGTLSTAMSRIMPPPTAVSMPHRIADGHGSPSDSAHPT